MVEIWCGWEVVIGQVRYGGFAQPTSRREDPMTDARMALIELLQKSEDGDFLRSVAEAVLQLLMEADVGGLIGAGRHERSPTVQARGPKAHERLNYRNGYRDRTFDTRLGCLSRRIPKLRQGLPRHRLGARISRLFSSRARPPRKRWSR